MDVEIKPGKYVLAVSGGVDSMVLFDILRQKNGVELVVAHFDHGIRDDSAEDCLFVRQVAEQHGVAFVSQQGHLGTNASEEKARIARYAFLEKVRVEQGANAIITAHHQDDLLETAILNVLRGTGRKGLSSLQSRPGLLRPLLSIPKVDILAYAAAHDVRWREDSTNASDVYLRNYVRRTIMPRFDATARKDLLERIFRATHSNTEIDILLTEVSEDSTTPEIDRKRFVALPYGVATEIMAAWLRHNGVRDFNRVLIESLVVAGMTFAPGKLKDVNATTVLKIGKQKLELLPREARKN